MHNVIHWQSRDIQTSAISLSLLTALRTVAAAVVLYERKKSKVRQAMQLTKLVSSTFALPNCLLLMVLATINEQLVGTFQRSPQKLNLELQLNS